MDAHVQGGSERQHVRVVVADERRAELALRGEVTGAAAREIEEAMLDPALRAVGEWVFDLGEVERLDAICAYALVRPLLMTNSSDAVHVRGAAKQVRRALHRTGANHLITFED
ncbi:STAS domain-containing protein [Streptomyces sp. NPDC012794]|uniref:STAS domain-containing protein n=1 Tax=Streptomyces sp. NPDC012794 TaxID=3364850 RepID=UPI00368E46C3